MPKVNLLPKEELEQMPLGRFLKWALSYGRYIIICVELVVFMVFFSRFIYDRQLAELNDEIDQKQAIVASAQQFEKKFRSVQSHISYVEALDKDRKLYFDTITTLEEITPIQVTYTTVTFQNLELALEGEALNNESFAQLLAQLKKNDSFSTITLNSLEKDEEKENSIVFNITIVIKSSEPVAGDQESQSDVPTNE
jgi:Tfp pilus assembly protein PilN